MSMEALADNRGYLQIKATVLPQPIINIGTDIYDFHYKGASPSEHGATVQAAFPPLGFGGRVFRDHVEFSRDTLSFNYDFN